ncbi:hypothetical protein HWV62_16212 [Athelia sp. TMB]|nr:hypothetical protein HWV62_16212 [Athelia sp. TMB]
MTLPLWVDLHEVDESTTVESNAEPRSILLDLRLDETANLESPSVPPNPEEDLLPDLEEDDSGGDMPDLAEEEPPMFLAVDGNFRLRRKAPSESPDQGPREEDMQRG